jgi:Fur family transcriptional regulator, zinc uptake regulator
MVNQKHILLQLKEKGHRFSAMRNFILDSLSRNNKPLSAPDFQELLKKNEIFANKTTLYRELNLLKKEKIILEIQLTGNKRWYELASRNHHHHIVCIKCDKVKDFIECGSKNIISKVLKQTPDFAEITNHTFDFFGLCKSCVNK